MRSKLFLSLSLLSLSLLAQSPVATTTQPCAVTVQSQQPNSEAAWLQLVKLFVPPILATCLGAGITLLGIRMNNKHNEKQSMKAELRKLQIEAYNDCIGLLVELRSLSLSVQEHHTALTDNPSAENQSAFINCDNTMTNATLRLMKSLNLLTLSRSTAGAESFRQHGAKLARRIKWGEEKAFDQYLDDLSVCQMALVKAGTTDIWGEKP
jgi:hypothetical protein